MQSMMNNMVNGFRGFMQNPAQMLMQSKLGIPQEYANDPGKAIQYLMDNGKISQAQYNHAKQMAEQMKSNPMFQQIFRR